MAGENAASSHVDSSLIDEQIKDLFKFKILLLGAGESGKSTIVKQLKFIYKKKLDDEELRLTVDSLHQNVVDCMKALVIAAGTFDIPFNKEEQVGVELVSELANGNYGGRISPEQGQELLKLWRGPTLQKVYVRRNEFWLLDSFPYYVDNLQRFCEPDYEANEEDAIMARIRTTGIVVTELEQKVVSENEFEPSMLLFQVVDVGGQRNERKKWIHCFDDVRAVLFCENLAGYNQVLFEDSTKNRMRESLDLFGTVTGNKLFAETPLFLFLNKKDLFEQMIQQYDLALEFKEYTGGLNMRRALEHIIGMFKAKCPPGKDVQVEVVAASVRAEIKGAFNSVRMELYDRHKEELIAQVRELRKSQKGAGGAGGGGCCTIA